MVRVAAVQPDPNARPIRAGIGAGRLTTRDEPGRENATDNNEDGHCDEPAAIVEPRDLAPERPSEDTRPTARRTIDQLGRELILDTRDPFGDGTGQRDGFGGVPHCVQHVRTPRAEAKPFTFNRA